MSATTRLVSPPEHDLILALTGLRADPVTDDQQVSLRAEAHPAGDHRYRHAPDHELRLEYWPTTTSHCVTQQ
ncbi:hypothetical protein E0H73_40770 [Kribbella pittospori]|uniref:Uncharacterized protein n=1 Tax=Kribbella pittospori TaxID=722689 RepID=A0A4R0JXD3_9ACTN|nr:hypothetical protein [Kribbella pittospori]TCC51460.1 hypothetical protein E0H73_40770 [Kribbella pittospori]